MNDNPMNPDKMTDQEVHIALLEAMGWTDIHTHKISGKRVATSPDGNPGCLFPPLNSTLDYNLIHEAEMMMLTSSPPVGSWDLYVETVTEKTKDPYRAFFLHIQSNPIKLARALLKALGKSGEN